MSQHKYSNFVRPSSPSEARIYTLHLNLSGDEARKFYLEEVTEIADPEPASCNTPQQDTTIRRNKSKYPIDKGLTTKDLFMAAQNNDIATLRLLLDNSPDKINVKDDYGWNLLMIACQANSVDVVKELLSRDIDTSCRDKAGNSAQSLVIKNKNLILADLLLSRKKKPEKATQELQHKKVKLKEEYKCDICNRVYPHKEEHLSSTIHNINASKGKKIFANYKIPISNRGYQLMLKDGWDRESGLGPDGSGKRYPIKTVQKKDRKGLGHKIKDCTKKEEPVKLNRKVIERNHRSNKRMEIIFRREFY